MTVAAPHDALFRRLFSDREIAAGALRGALPPEIAARIDFATLELQPASHVDEALHAFQSDVVFRAKLAGREARLLLLLEHQSRADPFMPFRLLQYAVLLWDGFLRDHPKTKRLPLIVPIVWHQGAAGWRAPTDLLDLLDLTDEERVVLARYVPRMHFEIEELGRTSDADLRARRMTPEATLALAALRDVRDAADVPALVASWVELARSAATTEAGLRALGAVVRYVLEVHGGLDVEELAEIASTLLPGAGARIMATARELIEQGRAQGIAEGKAEGKAEGVLAGRRTTLRHLLRLKFREAATDTLLARLEAADAPTLDRWEEQVLAAPTIEAALS